MELAGSRAIAANLLMLYWRMASRVEYSGRVGKEFRMRLMRLTARGRKGRQRDSDQLKRDAVERCKIEIGESGCRPEGLYDLELCSEGGSRLGKISLQ